MTYSKRVLATDKQKTTLNWWEYHIGHCWMTGWQTIGDAFRIWADLMGSNYENYALPRTAENPEEECIEWFWATLGEDEIYPKHFLEELMQMVDDIDTGKIRTYPMEDVMNNLKGNTIDPSVLEDWMGEPLTEEKLKELQEGGYVVDEED